MSFLERVFARNEDIIGKWPFPFQSSLKRKLGFIMEIFHSEC